MVALLVALIGYLVYYVFLGLLPFADLIAGEVGDFFLIPFICLNSIPLFCCFLTLLLGIILKYWIPLFGSNRRKETPDPSNHHPGQDATTDDEIMFPDQDSAARG